MEHLTSFRNSTNKEGDIMSKELLNEINKLAENFGISTEDILYQLKHEQRLKYETEMAEKVEHNKNLTDRYFYTEVEPMHTMFPKMKRFYHVLSARSENEYRVECLMFNEHPAYWFEYQAHKADFAGDYYLGHFEFESFTVDSIMANSFSHMTEITKEEFDEHARRYLGEMLEMKWVADHYRYGGKLPSDPDWPQTEKQPLSFHG